MTCRDVHWVSVPNQPMADMSLYEFYSKEMEARPHPRVRFCLAYRIYTVGSHHLWGATLKVFCLTLTDSARGACCTSRAYPAFRLMVAAPWLTMRILHYLSTGYGVPQSTISILQVQVQAYMYIFHFATLIGHHTEIPMSAAIQPYYKFQGR